MLVPLILFWLFLGILTSFFVLFFSIYVLKRRMLVKFKKYTNSYINYKEKFYSFNVEWLINLMKSDNVKFDEKELKNQFISWKNIQLEWFMNLESLRKAILYLRINKASLFIKKIEECEKVANDFSDSFVKYSNQLMRQLQTENMKLKLLTFNESLEEMYGYISQETYQENPLKLEIDNYKNYATQVLNDKNKVITNEEVKNLVVYANKMVNYHQYILTIAHWTVLQQKVEDLINDNKIDREFKLRMQTQKHLLNKLVLEDSTKSRTISEQWKFIDEMQQAIVSEWRISTLKEWRTKNIEFIDLVFKKVNNINQIYTWFKNIKETKGLYWMDIASNEWEKTTEELLELQNEFFNNKNIVTLKEKNLGIQDYLNCYSNLMKMILLWISVTKEFINNFSSIMVSQAIMRVKNKDLLNQLDFLNREYTPNRDELYLGEKVLSNMKAPYTLEDNRLMNLAALTINQFLDYNYKQQSYEIIARALWKIINEKGDSFTDEEWDRISALYKNIEYKKFIEQTAKLCRKLKIA